MTKEEKDFIREIAQKEPIGFEELINEILGPRVYHYHYHYPSNDDDNACMYHLDD